MLQRLGAGPTMLGIGAVLTFLVRPLVDRLWIIGGTLSSIALLVGLVTLAAGAFVVWRGMKHDSAEQA